jgi:hypothetical protein
MRPSQIFMAAAAIGLLLTFAQAVEASPPAQVTPIAPALTQESAVSFLQVCLRKWMARDASLWNEVADGALVPKGFWPLEFKKTDVSDATIWTWGFDNLQAWISEPRIEDLASEVQIIAEVKTVEMRDFRGFPLKSLYPPSPRPDVIPSVKVKTLSLGVDFNKDGEISSKERTQIHELHGALYWEPFGW